MVSHHLPNSTLPYYENSDSRFSKKHLYSSIALDILLKFRFPEVNIALRCMHICIAHADANNSHVQILLPVFLKNINLVYQ